MAALSDVMRLAKPVCNKKDVPTLLLNRVVKVLGLTSDFLEAGYILPDGRLIDLSGKREGGPPGTRSLDHREVNRAFYDDKCLEAVLEATKIQQPYSGSNSMGMVLFMSLARALRTHMSMVGTDGSRDLYLDSHAAPTDGQERAIRRLIARFKKVNIVYTLYDEMGDDKLMEGEIPLASPGAAVALLEQMRKMCPTGVCRKSDVPKAGPAPIRFEYAVLPAGAPVSRRERETGYTFRGYPSGKVLVTDLLTGKVGTGDTPEQAMAKLE